MLLIRWSAGPVPPAAVSKQLTIKHNTVERNKAIAIPMAGLRTPGLVSYLGHNLLSANKPKILF